MKALLALVLALVLLEARGFEQAFNVKIISPKLQSVGIKKSYYATTDFDESRIYEVSLRFDGEIKDLFANELYSRIKRGDLLFEVYPKHLNALRREYELFSEVKDLIYAKLVDMDLGRYLYDEASFVPFYSNFDGVIIAKQIYKGSGFERGDALLKIADDSHMWVRAKIYQRDAELVSSFDNAKVLIDGIKEPLEASFYRILPHIDPQDLTFDLLLRVPNPHGNIMANMVAKVEFSKSSGEVLTIPKMSAIKRDGKFYVFVKNGDEYEPKEVSLTDLGNIYEIRSGLSANSQIAQNALFLLDSDALSSGKYMEDEW